MSYEDMLMMPLPPMFQTRARRTLYFPMTEKPVRVGWYEVAIPWSYGNDVHRFYWTGRAWRKWDGTLFRRFPYGAGWRGLARKPR